MKLIKVIILNSLIAIAAIFLYSPGFVGLWFGQGALRTAFMLSSMLFLFGSIVIGNAYVIGMFAANAKVYTKNDLTESDDVLEVLENLDTKHFRADKAEVLKQWDKMQKKAAAIRIVLSSFFSEEELTYKRFIAVLDGINDAFVDSTRTVINSIQLYSAYDYDQHENSMVLNECAGNVDKAIERNNQILQKLDVLMVEVTRLTDSDTDVDKMPAMVDLEELIGTVKYYK